MVYEIFVPSEILDDGQVDRVYDNPAAARRAAEELRTRLGVDLFVLRDGIPITQDGLDVDERSYEIHEVIDEDSQLRPNYRPGWGNWADYAVDADGETKKVWKPENPEDRFE